MFWADLLLTLLAFGLALQIGNNLHHVFKITNMDVIDNHVSDRFDCIKCPALREVVRDCRW